MTDVAITAGDALIDANGVSLPQAVAGAIEEPKALRFTRSGTNRGIAYAYHDTGSGINEAGIQSTAAVSTSGHTGRVRLTAIDHGGLLARVSLTTSGFTAETALRSSSGTGGIGYATGAGGTVTQNTSKSTGVTLDKATGEITMNGAALAGQTVVSFTLTNSAIAAGDLVIVQHVSAGTLGAYNCTATAGSGSATIYVSNLSAGSLSEAIVLKFVVIKAVTA
jgi:hypothetical protein